ncbi:MAG: alpha/beta fold hydrolase [Bradyrhizobium sp.]|nr:alpha/beta fold hydrolase [Bradyrhizobium sp.]
MPHIKHDGIETFYAERGEGPPIVLIHGAEADHSMFDRLVPHLCKHWRCIAYDQRDSGRTRNGTDEYPVERLADDVAGLIATLALPRAHIFGTSLGSVIAQNLAVRHPHRVDRLVLSSAIRAGQVMADFAPETANRLAKLRADPVVNADAIASHFFPEPHLREHPGLFASLRSGRSPEQAARRAGLLRRRYDLDLSAIANPTLVLVGAADRLIPPAHSLSIADEIAGSERHVLDGIGHVGSVQAPEATAQIITEFLNGGGKRR